jgi:hypothetical protein
MGGTRKALATREVPMTMAMSSDLGYRGNFVRACLYA